MEDTGLGFKTKDWNAGLGCCVGMQDRHSGTGMWDLECGIRMWDEGYRNGRRGWDAELGYRTGIWDHKCGNGIRDAGLG